MITLLKHELKYYFKNRIELVQFTVLFVSIIVLIPFGQLATFPHIQSLASTIAWIALILAVNLASGTIFQRDYESGKLEAYHTAGLTVEDVILAKWAALVIALAVPVALMVPILLLLLNLSISLWLHYLIGLESGLIDLTLIAALSAVLLMGRRKAGAALALVVLPLSIPIMIFGAHYLATDGALLQSSLFFLWGFGLLMLPILCLIGASCIRTSH